MNYLLYVLIITIGGIIGMFMDFTMDVKFRGWYFFLGGITGLITGAIIAC